MKKIILLSLLTIVGVLGLAQLAYADNSVLSAVPASLNSAVGAPFNVSVQLNPVGNKICVVKGTISFINLSCQNITLANGVMAQSSPTCANPSFLVGIPKCTTSMQNIFSVSVKGTQVGQASLSFPEIKVVGVGVDVPSIWQGGSYNITAAQPITSATNSGNNIAQQSNQEALPTAQQTNSGNNNALANIGAASLLTAGSRWFKYLAILFVVLIVGYIIYWFFIAKKKKKKEEEKNDSNKDSNVETTNKPN